MLNTCTIVVLGVKLCIFFMVDRCIYCVQNKKTTYEAISCFLWIIIIVRNIRPLSGLECQLVPLNAWVRFLR